MTDAVIDSIAQELARRKPRVIAVDGLHGVGKTTLAKRLAARIGVHCVHLDEFLEGGQGGFLDHLRWPELSASIGDDAVLVEGVCVLAVIERLGIACDYLIYVEEASPETRGRLDTGTLADEVAAYVRQYRPHEVATRVYRRGHPSGTHAHMSREEAQIDVAYINSRTKLAIVLALGGMMTLFVGLGTLVYGASGAQSTMIKVIGMEVSASGMGAVIMATSSVWAFFAYKARPQFSRRSERVEKFDEQARLTHMEERSSSTQAAAEPRKRSS